MTDKKKDDSRFNKKNSLLLQCTGLIVVTKRTEGDTFNTAVQKMLAKMRASCYDQSVRKKRTKIESLPQSVAQTSQSTIPCSEQTPFNRKALQPTSPRNQIQVFYEDGGRHTKSRQRGEDRSENWAPSICEFKKLPPEIQRQTLKGTGSPSSSAKSNHGISVITATIASFGRFSAAAYSKPEGTNAENAGSYNRSISERIDMEEFEIDQNQQPTQNTATGRHQNDNDDNNYKQGGPSFSDRLTEDQNLKSAGGNKNPPNASSSGQAESTAPRTTMGKNSQQLTTLKTLPNLLESNKDQLNENLSDVTKIPISRFNHATLESLPSTTVKPPLHPYPWKPPSAYHHKPSTKMCNENGSKNSCSYKSSNTQISQRQRISGSTTMDSEFVGSQRGAATILEENSTTTMTTMKSTLLTTRAASFLLKPSIVTNVANGVRLPVTTIREETVATDPKKPKRIMTLDFGRVINVKKKQRIGIFTEGSSAELETLSSPLRSKLSLMQWRKILKQDKV